MRNFTRSKQIRNPDDDFVLHGFRASYSEKPLALQNSRLTTTTSRLSQHMVDIEDNYRDKQYAESLGNLAKNLESVSRNVGNTLRRSVTFSGKQLNRELKDTIDKRVAEKDNVDLWYTSPVHINRQEYSLSPQHGASSRSRSPHKYSGTLGAALSLQNIPPRQRSYKEEEKYEENGEEDQLSLSFNDSIGLKYFPVTLSASYEMSNLDRKLEQLESKPRPRTAKPYIKTSYDAGSVNSMYLMGTEAPSTWESNPFYTSPYVSDLASLRMERLRIEEDRYLELKRLQELERLRGPKQKWYESTGPDFHYESRKNTELIKSQKHFDQLEQYKEELRKSSADCRKSYEAICV